MSKIFSVTIKGFQSHVNSTFHLSPGLTVITGPTDSGKTAILRALRWIIFGEPSGESFVNKVVGEAMVQVVLADGPILTKNRSKGKTAHCITYPDNREQLFETAAVPEEFTAVLGITKQTFGDFETALNFAYQLEAPFLISEPPSAGAKVLGKIAGTEVVDLAVKAVAKDTYAARQEITQASKLIEKIESDLLSYYDGLDELQEQLQTCEILLSQYDQKAVNTEKLQGYSDAWHRASSVIKEQEFKLERLANVPVLVIELQEVEAQYNRLKQLIALQDAYGKAAAVITNASIILANMPNLEQLAEDIGIIEQAGQRISSLTALSINHHRVVLQVAAAGQTLAATADLDLITSQLEQIVSFDSKLTNLKLLQQKYGGINSLIRERQVVIDATAAINQAAIAIDELQAKQNRLVRLNELQAAYRVKTDTLTQAFLKLTAANKAAIDQQDILNALWTELKICPLCDQPITKGA